MLGLVVAHLVLACLLPLVSARSRRAGFAVAAVPPAAALPRELAGLSGYASPAGLGLQLTPRRTGTDGFFVAVLRRAA